MGIIMINKHSGIDDFTSNIAFVKSNQYYFQIQNAKKLGYRLSNEYLAYIEDNRIANYGWFAIKNGIILNKLDNIDYILDSLNLSDKEYFIRETNGYIDFYLLGRVQKTLNYSDFVLNDKNINVDNLDYGLYKLDSGMLKLLSHDGNDIENQKDGVFFVSSPGYGIVEKYRIGDILSAVDSISKLKNSPNNFKVSVK